MSAPLVLVHGGAHGAWCWQPTIEVMSPDALAIDLPPKAVRGVRDADPPPPELGTRTLDDWATSAIADIDGAGIDRFVLVGHSMGGLTISEVARRIPDRIRHVVYISCMVPAEGALVLDGVPQDSKEPAEHLLDGGDPGEPRAGLGLDDARIRYMFCNDMDEEQAQFVVDHTGGEVSAVFGETVSRVGMPPELPKTYVRLLRDQALWPSDQDRAIANLRSSPGGALDVVELDTGHDVMVSAPKQLARVLDDIAEQAGE